MSTTSYEEKSERIVPFNKDIVNGNTKTPRVGKVIDPDKAADMLEYEVREKNALAYGDLILAQEDEVAFGLVDEVCTEALPEGDAHLEFLKLKRKYEGTSISIMLSMKKEYNTSRMSDKSEDPHFWISGLKKLKTQLTRDF